MVTRRPFLDENKNLKFQFSFFGAFLFPLNNKKHENAKTLFLAF